MKLRIKYAKTGCLKFIGHLDVMRYFQKAIRRAGLDVAYSQGYSPHQLITFAAPLGLGVTSEGEYFDGEFHSATSSEDMTKRLNDVMAEGMHVIDVRELPQKAKTAMAVVSVSDYYVTVKPGYYESMRAKMQSEFRSFIGLPEIPILKKTKKSETMTDIRPMILEAYVTQETSCLFFDEEWKQSDDFYTFYMKLSTGSISNLKPELVMEAYCKYLDIPYENFGFHVHRLETYMDGADGGLISLNEAGHNIFETGRNGDTNEPE